MHFLRTLATVALPAAYFELVLRRHEGRNATPQYVILFVLYRYFAVRSACEQHVAAKLADETFGAAGKQRELVEALLEGLLPTHIVPLVNFGDLTRSDSEEPEVLAPAHVHAINGCAGGHFSSPVGEKGRLTLQQTYTATTAHTPQQTSPTNNPFSFNLTMRVALRLGAPSAATVRERRRGRKRLPRTEVVEALRYHSAAQETEAIGVACRCASQGSVFCSPQENVRAGNDILMS